MPVTRRGRAVLALAVSGGLSALPTTVQRASGQQVPNDLTVFHSQTVSDNGTTTASFVTGGNWNASNADYSAMPYTNGNSLAAGTAPTAGYAYVATGSAAGAGAFVNTPRDTAAYTFGGNSLTIIPPNGQINLNQQNPNLVNAADQYAVLNLNGTATTVSAAQVITIGSEGATTGGLVLANGGTIANFGNGVQVLDGHINLVPAGVTLDGITTGGVGNLTPSGGIIDTRTGTVDYMIIKSTITGAGLLHVLTTGVSSTVGVAFLNSSSYASSAPNDPVQSFTGGVLLDNTTPFNSTIAAGSKTLPLLEINNPGALGTGLFTVTSVGTGPTISNSTGAAETLVTNNAMQWNGSFQFGYNGGSGTLALTTSPLNLGSGAVTLGGNVAINTIYSTLTVGGAIASPSGTYGVTKTGAGTLVLGGRLSYTGATTVSAGTLELVAPGSTIAGPTVASGATLAVAFGGAGQFTADDIANLLGTTNFASGALFGIDTSAGSATYSSNLSGSFGFNKIGPNTLTLTGTVNYTGPTTVTAGTLQLSPTTTLSPTAAVTVLANAVLDLNGNNISVGSLAGSNVGSAYPTVTNNGATASTLTVAGGSYGGILTDGTSALGLKINTTTVVTLSGPGNSYSRNTTLSAGTLLINSSSALPGGSAINFSGGILAFSASYTNDPSGQFLTIPGQLYSFNTNSQSISLGGNLTSAGGTLTKSGAGTLTLNGTNTYGGSTAINGGTLVVGSSAAVGGTSGITVANGASFSINDNSGLAGLAGAVPGGTPITINATGTGVSNGGAVNGSGTWAGNIAVSQTGSAVTVITGSANSTLTVGTPGGNGGVIGGTGPVGFAATAGSTTVLNGSNTYSGETQILTPTGQSSTLRLGSAGAIPAASGINFATAGAGTLDLNGQIVTAAYLSGAAGNGVITNGGSSPSTLTLRTSGTASYTGAITNGNAPVAVSFTGSGTQIFTGSSSYSGGTNIAGGTLSAAVPTALGTGPVLLSGGTLSLVQTSGVLQSVVSGLATGSGPTQFQVNRAFGSTSAEDITGGVLTLTDLANTTGSEATSAFTNGTVPLGTNGFVTSFTYTATGRSGHFNADGATFTIQNVGPTAIGGNGGNMGYAGGTLNGPSAAVELNIYSYQATVGTAFATGGAFVAGTSYLAVTSPSLATEPISVTLAYNPTAQTLTETLVGQTNNGTYTHVYTGVNLASVVGGTSAYVGFTGSDGGDIAGQTISNFSYRTYGAGGSVAIANDVIAAPGTSSVVQLGVVRGQNVGGIGMLNVGAGATVSLASVSGDGIARTGVLTTTGITNAGKIDIGTSDILVQNAGPSGLSTVVNQIRAGFNLAAGGNWQGTTGITSSAAAASTLHLTAVGAILNSTASGQIYGNGTPFDGSTPGSNDVLVKYTYFGDANLDGKVDGADYSLIDAGFLSAASSGWYSGDFNYDGAVDGSDYTLIDNAFNRQGGTMTAASLIASPTALVAGTAAVPEPASTAAIALAVAALSGRRRNK